jgi:hypothetical protein
MRRIACEELETRWALAAVGTLTGTDGADRWIVWGQGETYYAFSQLQAGVATTALRSFHQPSSLVIDLKGGDDVLIYMGKAPAVVLAGAGDDIVSVDGAEGGPVYVDGQEGRDQISGGRFSDTLWGGAGDDVLLGGAGLDYLQGGLGDDLLIADAIDAAVSPGSIGQEWLGPARPMNERVRGVLRLYQPVSDSLADVVMESPGFDFLPGESADRFRVGGTVTGQVRSVTNGTQLAQALAQARAGDQIRLAAGVYQLDGDVTRSLAGISLTGAGPGQTILRGGSIRTSNLGDPSPTLIENMTFDLSGQSAIQGYLTFTAGTFYLDQIEVTGQGTSPLAAILFMKSSGSPTTGRVVRSYVHDVVADGLSTSGNPASPGESADSVLEIFDTRGERAGARSQDQLVTAHFGFSVVDIGGSYADAALNVIAADQLSTISLYGTRTAPGLRSGNVLLTTFGSVIDGAVLMLTSLQIGGRLENSVIVASSDATGSLVRVRFSHATIRRTTLLQPNRGQTTIGVYAWGANLTLTDNTFAGWRGQEWLLAAGTNTVERNTILP